MAKIYIGPNLLGLSTNTIFSGELPIQVQELIKKEPAIAGLIVPVEDLQKARKNMLVAGNVLNIHFKKLSKKGVVNGL